MAVRYLQQKEVPSPNPYAGFLYIGRNPLERQYLKVGETTKPVLKRKAGLMGQMQSVPIDLLFYAPCDDAKSAEILVHAYLDAMNCRVVQRKELFDVEFSVAKHLVLQAIAKARVRKAVAPVSREAAPVSLTHRTKAWQRALACPTTISGTTQPLGAWLYASLRDGKLTGQLARRGVQCTYNDLSAPDFQLQYLDEQSVAWLEEGGFRMNQLVDRRTGLLRGSFRAEPH